MSDDRTEDSKMLEELKSMHGMQIAATLERFVPRETQNIFTMTKSASVTFHDPNKPRHTGFRKLQLAEGTDIRLQEVRSGKRERVIFVATLSDHTADRISAGKHGRWDTVEFTMKEAAEAVPGLLRALYLCARFIEEPAAPEIEIDRGDAWGSW